MMVKSFGGAARMELFGLLGSQELTGKIEIWTSRRGKELDSRRGEEF